MSREIELYDPKLEATRAQQQAIYESELLKRFPDEHGFRDEDGLRLDAFLWETAPHLRGSIQALAKASMFIIGTGAQRRSSPPDITKRSVLRYQDVDHLIRNRQDYEESLGLQRKSGFYRVTKEVTTRGPRYFVWPLPPGARVPPPHSTQASAEEMASYLNKRSNPLDTHVWWEPPAEPYTHAELRDWLPPIQILLS